jgi:hypothetical protein
MLSGGSFKLNGVLHVFVVEGSQVDLHADR